MNNYFNSMGNNYLNGLDINNLNSFQNMSNSTNDINLINKLKKQAGDNMTFNMCGYNGDADPGNLFDVYNGFIRGNMFPDLYNQYKITRPYDVKPMNEQAELLTKVDAYCFAAHEVNLYLDTHPNDRDMINLFKELTLDSKTAIDEYEKEYGPLFVDSSVSYPWAWNNSPWPWEGN